MQLHQSAPAEAPLHSWEWPRHPWSRLHLDYLGPFQGRMFLILIDAYSKWLEVHLMNSTTSTFTIQERNELHTYSKFLISFDVESLFTNIPMDESIGIAVDYITTNDKNSTLNKEELRKLFTLATSQSYFPYNRVFLSDRWCCHGLTSWGSPPVNIQARMSCFIEHMDDQYG